MPAPTVEQIAQMIADHYDADLGLADVEPPNAADIALAQKIRNAIDAGTYFDHLSDVHGLSLFGHRIIATVLIGVVALIIVLTTHWSAQ